MCSVLLERKSRVETEVALHSVLERVEERICADTTTAKTESQDT